MKLRTVLHILLGLAAAALLISVATSLQAGIGSDADALMNAQRRTPLLWIVDACAIGLVIGIWWFAVMSSHFKDFVDHQAAQHQAQLDTVVERSLDLEVINDHNNGEISRIELDIARRFRELTDQIAVMERASEARHTALALETRRVAEHSFRQLENRLDSNTGQVDAMSVTLQYHRGELRRLRQHVRNLEAEMPLRYSPQIATSMRTEAPGRPLPAQAYTASATGDVSTQNDALVTEHVPPVANTAPPAARGSSTQEASPPPATRAAAGKRSGAAPATPALSSKPRAARNGLAVGPTAEPSGAGTVYSDAPAQSASTPAERRRAKRARDAEEQRG